MLIVTSIARSPSIVAQWLLACSNECPERYVDSAKSSAQEGRSRVSCQVHPDEHVDSAEGSHQHQASVQEDEDDNYDRSVLQQDDEVGDNMGAVAGDAFLGDGDTVEDGDPSEGEDAAAHPANPTRRTWTRSLRCVIVSWVRLLPCPVRAPNVALLKEVRVSDEDMVEVVACLARPSSFSAGVESLACTRPAES